MRWIAAVLLLGRLAAVELPIITRPDGGVQAYDLGATAPWMPLLWDRCTLTLPAGTTRAQLIARLDRSAYAGDDSDLLALRDGHRVTITSGGFTVAGLAGTWNGVRTGSASLVATIDQAISAADLLLLCRQLHYANLGGERRLARRRVELTVRAFTGGAWLDSLPLAIDVDPVAADQPPKLRFDAQIIPLGGAIDWRPLGWYDGRQSESQLRWRLQSMPTICTVTGLDGGIRGDRTAVLAASARPLDWFTAAQLQLQARAVLDDGVGILLVSDGYASTSVAIDVAVVQVDGELEIIGDLPFAIRAMDRVRLQASRPDVRFVTCLAHPATGLSNTVAAPFAVSVDGQAIHVVFDRLTPGQAVVDGCAIFEAGGSTYRLPYRFAVLPGTAN